MSALPEDQKRSDLSPIQLDLVNAWAESAALKTEIEQYKTAVNVLTRSHVNWQELAYGVEDRLAALAVAVRTFLDKPGCSTVMLHHAMEKIAQGPLLPRQ